jgi:tetratricopeptide (TPR) repeat protein
LTKTDLLNKLTRINGDLYFMKTRLVFFLLILLAMFIPSELFAKDVWVSVRSKNFFLVGNANEKEIRQVATKLEQFRESFRLIFPKAKFVANIPTNVVVFKNKSSYNPFRPKLANGKPNENVAGYFQPSEDLNYITISTEGEKEDTYGTIFHEYVHFLLDTNIGKSEIPPWFNEGLAEYYQTFKIENDQKVTLGDIQNGHLFLLQQNELLPLKTFFEVDNYSLLRNGNHSRSIFYAQAWALIHYLIQGNKGENNENMNEFLGLVLNKIEPEQAFKQAFEIDYPTMETSLKKYVSQRSYRTSVVTFNKKLLFDTEMTTLPLSDSDANAYLGDLLYHTREYADAEVYLQKSLAENGNSVLANTSLGLVKMRQRKFDEAKLLLEKATTIDTKNYLALYYYAYILSRESMDEFGYVSNYSSEKANKMRDILQKSIDINPNYSESYRLLGFIGLVNLEKLDESLVFLKKGLSLQPGNQEYSLYIAQILMHQEKFSEAKLLAEKLIKTASDETMKGNAQNLLNSIIRFEESRAAYEKRIKDSETNSPNVIKRTQEKPLTEKEIADIRKTNEINSLNRLIKRPKVGEVQVIGEIQKITCAKGEVLYSIKTKSETFILSSKDFSDLELISYLSDTDNSEVGCNAQLQNNLTVITFLQNKAPVKNIKGKLLALTFVPKFFELKTEEEAAKSQDIVVIEEASDDEKRGQFLDSIKRSLRIPKEGEKRELGSLEKFECVGKSIVFSIKTDSEVLRFKTDNPQDIVIIGFTREFSTFRMECGQAVPSNLAVITYKPSEDGKALNKGEITAIEFVPKTFTLEY